MAKGSRYLTRLTDLLFPPRCASCGKLLDVSELRDLLALCGKCATQWREAKEEPCGHCLLPVSECECMPELLERVACNGCYKLVYYLHGKRTSVQNRVIYRIKDTRNRRAEQFLAEELTRLLTEKAESGAFSFKNMVLSYIPRRKSASREKGTDQAKVLAHALSKKFEIPVLNCIIRTRGSEKEQKTLGPNERWRNARASYALRGDVSVKGKSVLLVDDIVTTGASLAACTQKLLKAGAASVWCVSVAVDDTDRYPIAPALTKKQKFDGGH